MGDYYFDEGRSMPIFRKIIIKKAVCFLLANVFLIVIAFLRRIFFKHERADWKIIPNVYPEDSLLKSWSVNHIHETGLIMAWGVSKTVVNTTHYHRPNLVVVTQNTLWNRHVVMGIAVPQDITREDRIAYIRHRVTFIGCCTKTLVLFRKCEVIGVDKNIVTNLNLCGYRPSDILHYHVKSSLKLCPSKHDWTTWFKINLYPRPVRRFELFLHDCNLAAHHSDLLISSCIYIPHSLALCFHLGQGIFHRLSIGIRGFLSYLDSVLPFL